MRFRFPSGGARADVLLNRTIVVEEPGESELQTRLDEYGAIDDLVDTLEEMTGETFEVVNTSTQFGVIRIRENAALANQRFTITGNVQRDLVIEGGNWRGCMHGLYAWLQELGVRQLAPGDRWRIVPSRSDLRLPLAIDRTPIFDTYSWFPQGAPSGGRWPLPAGQPTTHIDQWQAFLRRNSRPLAHYVHVDQPPENQAFGNHADHFVYEEFNVGEPPLNLKAQWDADDEHFSLQYRPWEPSTVYATGVGTTCNGHKYLAATGGTSHSSGSGPTGTGSGISDGTVEWNHYDAFCGDGGREHSERSVGRGLLHMTHGGVGGVDDPDDYESNEGGRTLYVDWMLRKIDAQIAGLPAKPQYADLKYGISVAVADGAVGCVDDKCINLLRGAFSIDEDARPSEHELWRGGILYEMAKDARPAFDFEVTTYAYDRQSPPPIPGWPINPNIRVLLAPYIYATDGLPEIVLLERWGDRRAEDGFKLGMYDYWSLPTFVFSNATFQASKAWRRVRDWVAAGLDTVTTESTYSAGSIAPQIWGLLQMNWKGTDLTYEQLMGEWCTQAFGAAAPHVKRMLDRWWAQEFPAFVAHAYEMGRAFDDLAQADTAVVADAGSRSRVAAMMAYLLWLHHFFLYWDMRNKTTPSEEDADEVMGAYLTHTWRSAHTIMIDTKWVQDDAMSYTATSTDFATDWALPSDEEEWGDWRTTNGLTPYTDDEIRAAFEAVKEDYTPIIEAATFTTPGATLTTPGTPSGTDPIAANAMPGNEGPTTGCEYIFEVTDTAAGVLRFSCSASSSYEAGIRFILTNAETGAAESETDFSVPLGGALAHHDIDLTALAVGYYRIRVMNARGEISHTVTCRGDLPIVRVGAYQRITWNVANGFYPRYLFIPKGIEFFHYFCPGPVTRFYDPTDEFEYDVTEIATSIWRIDVPSGRDQRIVRWEGNPAGGVDHGVERLLDIPEWTSPTAAQMIVPFNLWNE